MPNWKTKPTGHARKLRRNSTDAESVLWKHLRGRAVGSRKFRRQHAVGPYVLDFVCLEDRLVVEVDGGQHADNTEYGERRTRWLAAEGFRVVRFWNNDVLDNVEGVVERIISAFEGPHPDPLPQAGEGDYFAKPDDL